MTSDLNALSSLIRENLYFSEVVAANKQQLSPFVYEYLECQFLSACAASVVSW